MEFEWAQSEQLEIDMAEKQQMEFELSWMEKKAGLKKHNFFLLS